MAPTDPVPATLMELGSSGPQVRMRFLLAGGEDVTVATTVPTPTSHALLHIHALHSHDPRCTGRVDIHVDLFLRCCRAMGGAVCKLLVRPDPHAGLLAGDRPTLR